MARMFLVDGSNHAFRVQFALPPRHTHDGFPTRVLYGFTLLFQKMLRTWQPDYVVVAFDAGGNFRNEIYPDYKGHRPDMPEDLREQWPHLPGLVEAFGYKAIMLEGYEADDVLGTLAKRFAGPDMEVFLVTSDKDFCQLVDDNIQMLDEAKGVVIDEDGVVEKLGVPANRVIDMLALAGDSSDNIPGITKVGPKTAAKLLDAHGDLEGVLAAAAAGKIKGKTGERLVSEADNARLSYTLATIHTEVPLDLDLEAITPRGLQEVDLHDLFDRWEFGLVARKLFPDREVQGVGDFQVAAKDDGAAGALARFEKGEAPHVALRLSDASPPEFLGIAIAAEEGDAAYVPLADAGLRERVLKALSNPDVPKVMHGAKAVYRAMQAHGLALRGVQDDLRILDYVLAAHRRTHGLDDLSTRHLGHTLGTTAAQASDPDAARTAEQASVIARVLPKLSSRLDDGQAAIYRELELPLTPVLARMEAAGICLDVARIDAVSEELGERLEALEAECHELAGKPFSIRSRHELRDILFEDLGLTPSKKVSDGWSTASSVLEKLVDEHALPGKVLEYRSLDKLRSTYLLKLPDYVAEDGRVHTTLHQAVAATGRLSSADPNMQNIPVRSKEGQRIRACFVPEQGCRFLSADYSQVELRVLAHFSEDPVLIEGFRNGEDIHKRTAVELFGVDPRLVSIAQRSAAKAINFGLLYGMSAFRLGNDLSIPQKEAQKHMDAYFARMPAVKGWIEATKEGARSDGYVTTAYGRRRIIPEIHASSWTERAAAEREAVNTVIQGTAADIIKRAMLKVAAALDASDLTAKMILQVHDELLFEVPEAEVDALTALVTEAMCAAADLKVPLVVNTSVGEDWQQAHG